MSHKIPQSVLVVIHTPALEVLLIERADAAGFWQSVTGSKDTLTESWFDTAVREVHEETGLDALPDTRSPTGRWRMCTRFTPAGGTATPPA